MDGGNEINTVEQLSDALLAGARDSMDDPSADLPPLLVRIAQRQEATKENPRRSGPKRWYPARDAAWPLTVDGAPPISAIIAAIAGDEKNGGEVKGVFDLVFLSKSTDPAGVEKLEVVGTQTVRVNIGRAVDAAAAAAGAEKSTGPAPLPESIGPPQATALHAHWERREATIHAQDALRLKHDQTMGATVDRLLARLETSTTLAITSAQNQIEVANGAARTAIALQEAVEKTAVSVSRVAESLQQAAKGVQLVGESAYNRQLGVVVPSKGPGVVQQVVDGIKELVPMVAMFAGGPGLPGLPAPGAEAPAAPAPAAPAADVQAPAPAAPAAPAADVQAPAPAAPAAPAAAPAAPAPAEAPAASESVESIVTRIVDNRLQALVEQFAPMIERMTAAPAPAEAPAAPAEAAPPVKPARKRRGKEGT